MLINVSKGKLSIFSSISFLHFRTYLHFIIYIFIFDYYIDLFTNTHVTPKRLGNVCKNFL